MDWLVKNLLIFDREFMAIHKGNKLKFIIGLKLIYGANAFDFVFEQL
jgi:hypothetical protein